MSSSGSSSSDSSSGASSVKKGYSNREKALFAVCGVLSTLLIGSVTLVSSSVFGSTVCSKPTPIPAPGELELQQGCHCPAPIKIKCPAPATGKSCSSYKPLKPPYPCLNYDDGEQSRDNHYRCDFFPGTSPNKKLTGFINFFQYLSNQGVDHFEIESMQIYNIYKDPNGNGKITLHFYEFTNSIESCDEMGKIYNPDDPVGWFRPGALGAFGPNIPVTWDAKNGTGRAMYDSSMGHRVWRQQTDFNKKSHTVGPYLLLGRGIVLRSMPGYGMKSRTNKYRWPTYEGEGMRLGCCTLGRYDRRSADVIP